MRGTKPRRSTVDVAGAGGSRRAGGNATVSGGLAGRNSSRERVFSAASTQIAHRTRALVRGAIECLIVCDRGRNGELSLEDYRTDTECINTLLCEECHKHLTTACPETGAKFREIGSLMRHATPTRNHPQPSLLPTLMTEAASKTGEGFLFFSQRNPEIRASITTRCSERGTQKNTQTKPRQSLATHPAKTHAGLARPLQ